MVEGLRDSFIENDVIGNYNVGTNFMGNISSRKSKRKSKKRRKKGIFGRLFKKKRSRRKHRTRRVKRTRTSKKARKGIHYTKNGQPYKILSNGRARFIKGNRKK